MGPRRHVRGEDLFRVHPPDPVFHTPNTLLPPKPLAGEGRVGEGECG